MGPAAAESPGGLRGVLWRTIRPQDRAEATRTGAIFLMVGGALLFLRNVVAYTLFGSTEPSGEPTSAAGFVIGTIVIPLVLIGGALILPRPAAVRSALLGVPLPVASVLLIVALQLGFRDYSAGSQLYVILVVVWAAYFLRPVACAITVAVTVVGAVVVASQRPGGLAFSGIAYLIVAIVILAGMILHLRMATEATEAALARRIGMDALTGLATRAVLDDLGARQIADATGAGRVVGLLVLDVDLFKQVNDTRGHTAGDAVLRHLAGELERHAGDGDVAARLGGDEFALLMADTSHDDALARADVLVEQIRSSDVRVGSGDPISYTVSCGVAVTGPGGPADIEALYVAADASLYRAKVAGRDRASG